MMKNIILTTLLLLAGKASFGQVAPTDWQKMNLKGKVKTITEIEYAASENFGKVEKGEIITKYEYSFHESGYLAYKNLYNSEDKLASKVVYKYDAQNNLTENTQYDENGKILLRYVYTTNAQDKTMTMKGYTDDGSLTSLYIRRYNAQKMLLEEASYNVNDNVLTNKETRQYDAKGGLVHISYNHPKLGKTFEEIFVVDEQNNNLKETSLQYEGSEVKYKSFKSYQYTYEGKGNWITQTKFRTEANIVKTISERTYTYY